MDKQKKSGTAGRPKSLLVNGNVHPVCIKDTTEDEVKQSFVPKKMQSVELRDVYFEIGLTDRATRVDACGSFLEFHVQADKQKLAHANFCKDRLCPMCAWRRSLKIFGQVSQVMDVLQNSGYQFLFLTLTVRNCDGLDLRKTLDAMQKGWTRLLHRKAVSGVVLGTFRAIEITRNVKTGQYHPHYHVILAVHGGYFKSPKYIKQAEWAQMWRDCCDLEYDPIIDIRSIKSNPKGISGAVAEVAKYAVKGSTYLHGTWQERADAVNDLLLGLTNKKLVSWTGVFLYVVKMLNLDDTDTGDLVHVSADDLRPDVAYLIVRWQWVAGCYQRIEIEHVSP